MPNGRKRLFATFAGAVLAAASLTPAVAAPAPADTSVGAEENYYPGCYDVTTGGQYPYGGGYNCCVYDEAWQGWYIMYATHWEPCTPPYGAPEIGDGASRETAGQ